jgi:hypothetical protein
LNNDKQNAPSQINLRNATVSKQNDQILLKNNDMSDGNEDSIAPLDSIDLIGSKYEYSLLIGHCLD